MITAAARINTQAEALDACLRSLSPEECQIVVLHAVSGFKHRQIAQVLELPISTVLSKYNRALKRLRTMLEGGQKVCVSA